ncbi:MAG TPA: hypothetical protein VH300_19295 [Thermoleophilaceae bacterium]|nr:hypothetical protein [Thermoleophilaceae bacterium]
MSAAPLLPSNTNSTRSVHFRTLIGSSAAIVAGAIFAAIAFTVGAASHSVAVMGGGPALVVVAVVLIAWVKADSDAEDEFFRRYADVHRLNLWPKYSLDGFTPLLAGGDRRHCEHWMEAGGHGLGWYTFEVRQDHGDKPDTWESHDFTLATVDIGELGMGRFQGVYLRRRRGIFDRLDGDANWLRGHNLKKVELESTAFTERYELSAERDQDDIILRQLFAPSFVVWLSEHPLEPGFELRAGMLVVFIPGRCGEAGRLQFLQMAADEISKRIQAELTAAAQAGAL